MIWTKVLPVLLAAALIGGGLALWWQYGLAIVLAEPSWLCLSR